MPEKLKNLDHYRRSVLAMLPIAAALLLFLLLAHSSSLFLDSWFLDLITIPMFLSNMVSGSTYIGRLFDFVKDDFPANRTKERALTVVGVICGLAMGILLSLAHAPVPFAPVLCGFANVLFTFNRISVFAGLGARVGSVVDSARPTNERYSLAAATIAGISVGIALFLTSSAALASIAGVTTILTGGAALPLWVGGFIFISTFSSGMGALADYASKAFNFAFERDKQTPAGEWIRGGRFHEYRGSFVGASTGLVVATVVLAVFMVTQPYLLAGAAGFAAAVFLVATCVGLFGGVCSRVGRLWDGLQQQTAAAAKSDTTQDVLQALTPAGEKLFFQHSNALPPSAPASKTAASDTNAAPTATAEGIVTDCRRNDGHHPTPCANTALSAP